MMGLKRILLPTDFSEHSAAAAAYACELASKFDAELHVLNVLEFPNLPDFIVRLLPTPPVREKRTAAAESLLAEFAGAHLSEVRPVVNAVAEGVPFLEIVRYAREKEIDLIVVSTHGRSGLAHALMGSEAEKILRSAPCPVLTVRAKGHQFEMP